MRSFKRVFGLALIAAGLCLAQNAPAKAGCLGFSGTADGFDKETAVSRAQAAVADAITQYKAVEEARVRDGDSHASQAAALLARRRARQCLLQAGHREGKFLHHLLAGRGLALCLHLGRQNLLVIRKVLHRAPGASPRGRSHSRSSPGRLRRSMRRHELDLLRLLHKEDQRDDGQRHDPDEPEQIVEGEHLRLTGNLMRDQRA